MKSRQQYLAWEITHEDYYRQFVTQPILDAVQRDIGIDRIKRSKDDSFNDIALHRWDAFHPLIAVQCSAALKEAGDTLSLSSTVCIAKQAAHMLLEGVMSK